MTYHIESLGCAKNQVDSEELMAALDANGFVRAGPEGAELIIVRSCGFIEAAKRESINTVLEFRAAREDARIVLSGCLARRYGKELSESLTEADIIYSGTDDEGLIRLISGTGLDVAQTASASSGKRPLLSTPGSAYVKIAEGCDNRCGFCAIPLMRGPLRSRGIDDIMTEFRVLVSRGIYEICLIAQDTASFGLDTEGRPLLGALLRRISAESGDFWVRLLYLHPDHFPEDILPVMQNDARFLPYFDIPFQHASKKILALMGRTGTGESYLGLLEKIRAVFPDAVFRSTFLAGFPGETEDDFKELLDFQRKAALDWVGVFGYSREEGTSAADMPGRCGAKTIAGRKIALETAQVPVSESRLSRFLSRRLDILVESPVDTDCGLYIGRAFLHAPEVDGAAVIESAGPLTSGTVVTGTVRSMAGFDIRVFVGD